MAYLDSAGNVDSTAGPTVDQWQRFHAMQNAVDATVKGNLKAPTVSLPSGAEKASKRS